MLRLVKWTSKIGRGRKPVADAQEIRFDHQHRVLARLRAAESQDEIAKRAGLKYWRYVHLEQGRSKLTGDEFWSLARAYGLTPFELARELGYPLGLSDWRVHLLSLGMTPDEVVTIMQECQGKDATTVTSYLEAKLDFWRQRRPVSNDTHSDSQQRTG